MFHSIVFILNRDGAEIFFCKIRLSPNYDSPFKIFRHLNVRLLEIGSEIANSARSSSAALLLQCIMQGPATVLKLIMHMSQMAQ